MTQTTTFGMQDAARFTGVSVPLLTRWMGRGLIKSSFNLGPGRGLGNRWTLPDLVGLRTIAALRAQGVSMQRVKKICEKLSSLTGKYRTLDALAAMRLLVLPDGEIVLARNVDELVSLFSGQHLMTAILVDLKEPAEVIELEIRKALPPKDIAELEKGGLIPKAA